MIQAPPITAEAAITFALATSLIVPCSSGRSKSRDSRSKGDVELEDKIVRTSRSLFAFPARRYCDQLTTSYQRAGHEPVTKISLVVIVARCDDR